MYREVSVIEVREVLRAWLAGSGFRTAGAQAGVDRKTARRYVAAAVAAGLDRDGGVDQLTDELIGTVVAAVRPDRPQGYGSAWEALCANHDRINKWVKDGLTVVKIGDLLARQGVVVPPRTLHRYCAERTEYRGRGGTVPVVDGSTMISRGIVVTKTTNPVVTDPISADLKKVMRQLKLGRMLDTLPERLTLARQRHLSHAAFLELVLADEASRRDTSSAARRARESGLDAAMRLDTWDDSAAVRYDRTLWTDLTSLRFLDGPYGALLLGAVGVGKTHLATALGHIAVRRRVPTLMLRADAMFKQLKASRLDNSTEAEMRRLAQVRLLIVDDLALQPMDDTATADFYELVVARHQKAATVVTSNRGPDEWLPIMTDPLLAQSAVDRLTSTAHELVIEGPSYRRRQKPTVDTRPNNPR